MKRLFAFIYKRLRLLLIKKNIKIILIYICLFAVSLGLFILALKLERGAVIQSILLSFSINIFTSLIIIFCVDLNVEKRAEMLKEFNEKATEKQRIMDFHKNVEVMMVAYKTVFNQLTIPLDKRVKGNRILCIDCEHINNKFELPDIDVYSPNITLYGEMGSDALETYHTVYKKTVHTFENMFASCSFKNYSSLSDSISSIINLSLQPYGYEGICRFKTNEISKQALVDMISKYEGTPFDDIYNNKYDGNLFIHPLYLYRHLFLMREAVDKYYSEIEKLKEE